MSNLTEYKDIVAFHPGYYIADIIEDMGVSQAEFAQRMGTTAKTLSKLINGKANISNDLAKKLSIMMGTSVDLWLNLQKEYDNKIVSIQQEKDLDEQIEVAKKIDYKFFLDNAKLPVATTLREKVANLCSFLKIADLRILLEPDFLVNYRSGVVRDKEKNIINSKAWIQTAINLTKDMDIKPYDGNKLKSYLPEIKQMTIQKPEDFFPRLKEIFRECGVLFIILPYLKNSNINGAVKWLNENKVILAMNNKGLNADIFWFSLFHEIKHVLQHKTTTVFISGKVEEMIDYNNSLEKEADRFAADYLIPPKAYQQFSPTKYSSDDQIKAFAMSQGIHPGIVAGRMQHDGIISRERCSNLKEKYVFSN